MAPPRTRATTRRENDRTTSARIQHAERAAAPAAQTARYVSRNCPLGDEKAVTEAEAAAFEDSFTDEFTEEAADGRFASSTPLNGHENEQEMLGMNSLIGETEEETPEMDQREYDTHARHFVHQHQDDYEDQDFLSFSDDDATGNIIVPDSPVANRNQRLPPSGRRRLSQQRQDDADANSIAEDDVLDSGAKRSGRGRKEKEAAVDADSGETTKTKKAKGEPKPHLRASNAFQVTLGHIPLEKRDEVNAYFAKLPYRREVVVGFERYPGQPEAGFHVHAYVSCTRDINIYHLRTSMQKKFYPQLQEKRQQQDRSRRRNRNGNCYNDEEMVAAAEALAEEEEEEEVEFEVRTDGENVPFAEVPLREVERTHLLIDLVYEKLDNLQAENREFFRQNCPPHFCEEGTCAVCEEDLAEDEDDEYFVYVGEGQGSINIKALQNASRKKSSKMYCSKEDVNCFVKNVATKDLHFIKQMEIFFNGNPSISTIHPFIVNQGKGKYDIIRRYYDDRAQLEMERKEIQQWVARYREFYDKYVVIEGTWLHQLTTWCSNLVEQQLMIENVRKTHRLRRLRREQRVNKAMKPVDDFANLQRTLDRPELRARQEEDDRRLAAFELKLASDMDLLRKNVYLYGQSNFGKSFALEILLAHLLPRAFTVSLNSSQQFVFSGLADTHPCLYVPDGDAHLWNELRQAVLRLAEGRSCSFPQKHRNSVKMVYRNPVVIASNYPPPLNEDEAFCRRFTVINANKNWFECVKTVAELEAQGPRRFPRESNVLKPLAARPSRDPEPHWVITESRGVRVCIDVNAVAHHRVSVQVHHPSIRTNDTASGIHDSTLSAAAAGVGQDDYPQHSTHEDGSIRQTWFGTQPAHRVKTSESQGKPKPIAAPSSVVSTAAHGAKATTPAGQKSNEIQVTKKAVVNDAGSSRRSAEAIEVRRKAALELKKKKDLERSLAGTPTSADKTPWKDLSSTVGSSLGANTPTKSAAFTPVKDALPKISSLPRIGKLSAGHTPTSVGYSTPLKRPAVTPAATSNVRRRLSMGRSAPNTPLDLSLEIENLDGSYEDAYEPWVPKNKVYGYKNRIASSSDEDK